MQLLLFDAIDIDTNVAFESLPLWKMKRKNLVGWENFGCRWIRRRTRRREICKLPIQDGGGGGEWGGEEETKKCQMFIELGTPF